MRHRKHQSKLNRTSEHRLAMMRNLAAALVEHERIHTTQAKATQLRPFVESLVTLAKDGGLAKRRIIHSRIQDRMAAAKLCDEIAPRVAERAGGYTRIVKDGPRMGDGAPMAFIEFVDAAAAPAEGQGTQRKTLKQRMHEARKERERLRKQNA